MDSEYLAGLVTNKVSFCSFCKLQYMLENLILNNLLKSSHLMFWNVPVYEPLHLLQLSATSNLFLCPYFYFYIFKARKRQYMDKV